MLLAEGVLLQKTSKNGWQERYVVLENNALVLYKKKNDAHSMEGHTIASRCSITPVEFIKRMAKRPVYSFTIEFPTSSFKESEAMTGKDGGTSRGSDMLQFASENADSAAQWRMKLQRAIQLAVTAENDRQRSASSGLAAQLPSATETAVPVAGSRAFLQAVNKSCAMFTQEWAVAALFGGLQVWKEQMPNAPTSSAMAGDFSSGIGAVLLCTVAVYIGGGGFMISMIAMWASMIGCFVFYTSPLLAAGIPSFKISKVIDASPDQVFECLMDVASRDRWDASVARCRVIQTIDEHSDVIHIEYRPVWIWPVYITARDVCLLRYWQRQEDGSYVICVQSVLHPECPPSSSHVRATCRGGGFSISCQSEATDVTSEATAPSSLLTNVVHENPGGDVGKFLQRCGLMFHYMKPQIMAIVGLQEEFEFRKFVQVDLTSSGGESVVASRLDNSTRLGSIIGALPRTSIVDIENEKASTRPAMLETNLPQSMWCEPSSGGMLVRGPDYLADRRKIPSADPIFNLVGVDIFETDGPYQHIAKHPENVIQAELKKYDEAGEKMPFTFILNFLVPGNQYYSVVMYYRASSPTILQEQNPASELLMQFIETDDDTFRDERFKLIPRIVDGAFIVRQAVGSTPALIGKKLKQPYFSNPNYFEVDIDICSSAVANRVTGLVLGYTKKLVIDMGFCVEGQNPEELPERLFGIVQLNRIDLSVAPKLAKVD